ncbi:MAG TPA: NADH-quinone oxidoreductase subunit NuoB [Verrucomicrobiae bacterium]|nr:NADH-quinone oxidoreductase subunit NuoB [Verrucomicrobiae bacterium]
MLKVLLARTHQKYRTVGFPKEPPVLPDRLRGRPEINTALCAPNCTTCADVCPTDAIRVDARGVQIDLGRCLFCPACERSCPTGAIRFTPEHRLATSGRDALIVGEKDYQLAKSLDEKTRKIFGRSLKLRQVSAGGCNGCEADINVLNTVVFDLGRFGIQFVASPRHADGLVVTGPVTQNMELALRKTYEAMPSPKFVVVIGACAISGGPYINHAEQKNGADKILPVDLYIPGCPPHPITILDGLLRLLGKIEQVSANVPDDGAIRPPGRETNIRETRPHADTADKPIGPVPKPR